jgi:hypothetical protein
LTVKPGWVIHEGKRAHVVRSESQDDEAGYIIATGSLRKPCYLWARVTDCTPWQRTPGHKRTRRLESDGIVCLFDVVTGELTLKEKGRRKGYTATLRAHYYMSAKAEAKRLLDARKCARRDKKLGKGKA